MFHIMSETELSTEQSSHQHHARSSGNNDCELEILQSGQHHHLEVNQDDSSNGTKTLQVEMEVGICVVRVVMRHLTFVFLLIAQCQSCSFGRSEQDLVHLKMKFFLKMPVDNVKGLRVVAEQVRFST